MNDELIQRRTLPRRGTKTMAQMYENTGINIKGFLSMRGDMFNRDTHGILFVTGYRLFRSKMRIILKNQAFSLLELQRQFPILIAMNHSSHTKALSIVLIAAYLVSMVLAVGPHNHLVAQKKGDLPSLVSHDCGAKEKHKQIEGKDSCLPCFRSQNPVSSSVYCPFLSDVDVEHSRTDDVHATPNSVTSSYTPKRGPPSTHTAV